MCWIISLIFTTAVLDPVGKMAYFKRHWPENLHDKVLTTAEKVVRQPNFNFVHRSDSSASSKLDILS
jgi:hypothetical protein